MADGLLESEPIDFNRQLEMFESETPKLEMIEPAESDLFSIDGFLESTTIQSTSLASLLTDDGLSDSESIDLFPQFDNLESGMRQSEGLLLMADGLLESEPIDFNRQMFESETPKLEMIESAESDLFSIDGFLESTMMPSIPLDSCRNRSLNSKALGAPEHFTSIRKRRLRTSIAIDIQQRLKTLIAGARQSWTYAIFWKASYDDYVRGILDWGTGYYEDEEDKLSGTQSSKTKQDHRKRSLRDLYPEEDVNDLKRFFLKSKADIFFPGNGLLGRALCTSTAIWVSGAQKLAGFYCKHANGAQQCGIQTLVCIPLADGVVELGSSALIFPDSEFDLLDRVRPLFNFRNNICIQEIGTDSAGSTSIPPPIIGYESESSVGNRPLFQQGDSSSQRDKNTQSNSDSGSDSRYLEVFTLILRRS